MTTRQIVISEIKRIPDSLLKEVLDFVLFLELKARRGISETAILSESALKKIWLDKEEDKAWKDL